MINLRTNKKIELDGFIFTREGGYYRRGNTTPDNPERWLHRYVWHKHKGPIPDGYSVHHRDEDKTNNAIENLELLSFEDHAKHHGKNVKTDNSHLTEKIQLRLDTVNMIDKDYIRVLECFSGDGVIWDEVKKLTPKNIKILRMDQKPDKTGVYLKGDNLKFMKSMDFSVFDIVDLDAYGSPFKQLEIVFEKQYKGIVHCTFIQSVMGNLDRKFLEQLGYPKRMIEKTPTLFSKNGMVKMERWLAKKGVKNITGFFIERKNYFYF